MSVSEGHTLAALMPIATIPKGLTTVHVNLDSLEWKRMRGYVLLLRILSKGGGFSNFELSDKTKTTFTVILRTVCKGGLPNYCWFYSCWCFMFFFL